MIGTSVYHFRRKFSYLSGMSLGETIHNRRLSDATFDLLHKGMSVTETAFKYAYESVDKITESTRRCGKYCYYVGLKGVIL